MFCKSFKISPFSFKSRALSGSIDSALSTVTNAYDIITIFIMDNGFVGNTYLLMEKFVFTLTPHITNNQNI